MPMYNFSSTVFPDLNTKGISIYKNGVLVTASNASWTTNDRYLIKILDPMKRFKVNPKIYTNSGRNASLTMDWSVDLREASFRDTGIAYYGFLADVIDNESFYTITAEMIIEAKKYDLTLSAVRFGVEYTEDLIGFELYAGDTIKYTVGTEAGTSISTTNANGTFQVTAVKGVYSVLISRFVYTDISFIGFNEVLNDSIFTLGTIQEGIKQVLKNNVVVPVGTDFLLNDSITFHVIDGYLLENIVLVQNTGGNASLVISQDKKYASYKFNNPSSFFDSYTVDIYKIPPFVCYTLTESDLDYIVNKGVTISKNDAPAIIGDEFINEDIITLKANDLYFTELPTLNNTPFVFGVDNTIATYLINEDVLLTGFNINTIKFPIYTVAEIDLNVYVDFYINDVLMVVGSEIRGGDSLKAVAKTGREFYRNYINQWDNEEINSVGILRQNVQGFYPFELDNEGLTGTFKIPALAEKDWLYGFYSDTNILTPEQVKGFNSVYKVDINSLKLLASERFTKEVKQVVTVEGDTIARSELVDDVDHGIYMLGFIRLPMHIDDSMIYASEKIRLGNLRTNVDAELLSDDSITVDAGEIFTALEFNDVRDYNGIKTLIHLPYSEPVEIDYEYVIGEKVRVEYVVDLYTGIARVNLYSSKINAIFHSLDIDLNIKIPYATLENMPQGNSPKDIINGFNNNLLSAYIEVIKNETILLDSDLNPIFIDEGIVGDNKGLIKIEEILLGGNMSTDEKEMIRTLLRDGIKIND